MSANDIAMLSAQDCTIDDVEYPCLVSTKFDGIRALTKGGVAMSRNNIALPNKNLQAMFARLPNVLNNLDGEIIVGDETDPNCYNTTQSAVMSDDAQAPYRYFVFDDLTDEALPFDERQKRLRARFMTTEIPDWIVLVPQREVKNKEELVSLYEWLVERGHEGVITRRATAPYKRGRGTKKAQDMLKLKPREDSEFVVTGFVELQRNMNEAKIGERGQTKRSSAKAGKIAGGTLGKILARDIHTNENFVLGTFKGLKAKDKQYIWDHQDEFLGRIGVYSFCPVGVKKLPRQPSWKGWRDQIDM